MPDDATGRFTHGPADMQPVPASVRNWLIVVAAMIFFMIVIGALTRLTESGLSMVEWRPVTGWLPPLSDAAWQAELQKYLSSPQGRLINRGFTIAEFKEIFWLDTSIACGAGSSAWSSPCPWPGSGAAANFRRR